MAAHSLLKALKASDPPSTKIAIATQTCRDSSFKNPEIIVEWILLNNHHHEPTAWNLLHHILSSSQPNLWLAPLLSRVSIAPLLISFYKQLHVHPPLASSCFHIMWPLAVQRLSTDAILDCFGALLGAMRSCEPDQALARLGILTASSYTRSLHASSNKKKIHAHFVQHHLDAWIESTLHNHTDPLNHALYRAGAETLFNLDNLRQQLTVNSESSLFQAIKTLLSSSSVQPLSILPRLLVSYIEALKKYRGALFGQASDQIPGVPSADLHDCGMQFYAACKSLLDDGDQITESWTTKISLLALVDKERLFDSPQLHSKTVLYDDLEKATTALGSTDDKSASSAVEVISALARIDYDLVIPKLPCILPKLLLAQDPMQSCLTFLDLLLAYYTKLRKMDMYIDILFSTFSRLYTTSRMREFNCLSSTGPVFEATHLKHLSTAIQRFLADGQITNTAASTFEFLTKAWEQFDASQRKTELKDGADSRKKRKTTENTREEDESAAVIFSLSAHLAAIVLCSLPLQATSRANREQLDQQMNAIRSFTLSTVKKSLKRICKSKHDDVRSYAVVAAAALRLQYALDTSGTLPCPPVQDDKYSSILMGALQVDNLLSELRLEIIRLLLSKSSWQGSENRLLIDVVLRELEKTKSSGALGPSQLTPFASCKWTANARGLTLFHMVIDRWLPVIEFFASHEQLQRLVEIMMANNITDYCQSSTTLQGQSFLLQVLHSAHFWELPNFRNVFLGYLSQTVSTLGRRGVDPHLVLRSISAYRLLLLVPLDYITRSCRLEFTRRALLADRLITSSPSHSGRTYQDLIVLRLFLAHSLSRGRGTESTQDLCESLKNMMDFGSLPSESIDTFYSATLEVIDSLFVEVFKASEEPDLKAILALLQGFAQMNLFQLQLEKPNLRTRGFFRMITVLERDFTVDNLSRDFHSALCKLHETIARHVRLDIISYDISSQRPQNVLLAIWSSLLTFGKWLMLTNNMAPDLGKNLFSGSLRLSMQPVSSQPNETHSMVFNILLKELHYCSGNDRLSQLDLITTAYWSFSCRFEGSGRQQLDDLLSKTCKVLAVSEFTHLLQVVSGLLTNSESPTGCSSVVDLSGVLLRDPPKDTRKHVQSFSSQCLHTFAAWSGLVDGPIKLRVKTLHFLAQHCLERPAVLRLADMNSIWTLLARFLGGSGVHDADTTSDIFGAIITVIGALIRLRRDLITLTLPHLGTVLRQLMMSVRRLRPHLGIKQSTLVTDTQPRWLNAGQPIGIESIKAFSRVLETLATKTVIRSNAIYPDIQTAESLAKAFSKHAAFVLKAYVEAMSDPLCLIPYDVRKELQSGLYTLCGMVSDHTRDALMVSIPDAGGKSTMKALWKEYEKQRYVGKG